jgi:prepilin-type N-terminal cleavage/methylation domain-containing protein
MRRKTRGFSLIELTVSIVIAGILLDVAVRTTTPVQDSLSENSGVGVVTSLHAQARAQAVARGTMVRLIVDPATDMVTVSEGSETIETVDLRETRGIDILGSSQIRVCMTPRGFADTDCNSFESAVTVGLSRGESTSEVKLRPMGQIVIL